MNLKTTGKSPDKNSSVLTSSPAAPAQKGKKEKGQKPRRKSMFNKPNKTKRKSGSTPFPPQAQNATVHQWFFTLMCMNIPLVGWFYLMYLAFNRKNTSRRTFARAYLLYKLLFLILSAAILGALIYAGLQVADQVLAYMEML